MGAISQHLRKVGENNVLLNTSVEKIEGKKILFQKENPFRLLIYKLLQKALQQQNYW